VSDRSSYVRASMVHGEKPVLALPYLLKLLRNDFVCVQCSLLRMTSHGPRPTCSPTSANAGACKPSLPSTRRQHITG
jgi:hypothetical protein